MSTQDHIPILKAFDELKFNLGKRTLIDFIKGDPNQTIDKNNLDELDSFGSLFKLEKEDIGKIIEILIKEDMLENKVVGGGFKVVARNSKGGREIFERKLNIEEKLKNFSSTNSNFKFKTNDLFDTKTDISEEDKKHFKVFDFFLSKYNDEQKKAIISQQENILCVAGAGSGKTTVLTKRIEFLSKFKSVNQNKILAITFTKKAKEEMQHRLKELQITDAVVETFNSFCEKTLKKHSNLLYEEQVRVATYSDKIKLVNQALNQLEIKLETFAESYFNKRQLREKSKDELFFIFVNDIFSVIDYYKNLEQPIVQFFELEKNMMKKRVARNVYEIANLVEKNLKQKNLRDFSDQITDTLKLFRKYSETIPQFEHILVDEYQDVNLVQFELLQILKNKNLFAVGDPRQAIYGWRGSDVKFILNFPKIFKDTQIISLQKNYRSSKQIVDLFNLAIKPMKMLDLEANQEESPEKNLFLFEQTTEKLEQEFVAQAILNSKNDRNQIFVLARTNRILENYAAHFKTKKIKYAIKSEEEYKVSEPKEDEVILATIHSIKGMEAKEVYIVSANSLSFPNKVQDNFVFSLIKNDNDYDKYSEELRLFYVALSRAKEKLIITYTGTCSKFISNLMLEMFDYRPKNKSLFEFSDNIKSTTLNSGNSIVLKNLLKNWRADKANNLGLPTYMILSNKAIDSLVQYKPQNKWDLENLDGFGPTTVAKYGDEIMKLING